MNILKMRYDSLISELKGMKPVSNAALNEYMEKQEALIEKVNHGLVNSGLLTVGEWKRICKNMNNDQYMHIKFMRNIFRYRAYETLIKTHQWLHKLYRFSKFPPGFVLESHKTWMKCIEATLTAEHANEIIPYYEWLINNDEHLKHASLPNKGYGIFLDKDLDRVREDFLVYLVIGDFCKCLSISSEFVSQADDLLRYYLQVLQPCLYEVGYLWENGELTTAQEHLASSMVNRLMSYIFTKANMVTNVYKKAIVTTVPGEYHDIGARMVADFFEIYGWKVSYLGASTPVDSLIDLIYKERPDIIAISVTMFYHLDETEHLIADLKDKCKDLKIIVGGQAFHAEEAIWQMIGADGYAHTALEAVSLARRLTDS